MEKEEEEVKAEKHTLCMRSVIRISLWSISNTTYTRLQLQPFISCRWCAFVRIGNKMPNSKLVPSRYQWVHLHLEIIYIRPFVAHVMTEYIARNICNEFAFIYIYIYITCIQYTQRTAHTQTRRINKPKTMRRKMQKKQQCCFFLLYYFCAALRPKWNVSIREILYV